MTSPARQVARAKKAKDKLRARKDRKFMIRRKESLTLLPNVIRDWARDTLADFEDKGLTAGSVMPKMPSRDNNLWRVVFVLPEGIQCAECGETSSDGEARYTIFRVEETRWLSASCFACHKSREPGNVESPQRGDA